MLARLNVLNELPAPEVKEPNHEMDFLTNFERKYRREGRPIYRGVWQKHCTHLAPRDVLHLAERDEYTRYMHRRRSAAYSTTSGRKKPLLYTVSTDPSGKKRASTT